MIMNPPSRPALPSRNSTQQPMHGLERSQHDTGWAETTLISRSLPIGTALADFKRRHSHLAAGIVAGLAATLSALALAVSPLSLASPELPPTRLVTQEVEPLPVEPQLEALADHRSHFSRTLTIRGSDSLQALLARSGMADAAAAAALNQHEAVKTGMAARGVRLVELRNTAEGRLHGLTIRSAPALEAQHSTHFHQVAARNVEGTWQVSEELKPLTTTSRYASGTIRSSLFAATDESNVPESVAVQLAELFSGDIDFHRQLRKGDRFSIVYEALTADGEPVPWNQGAGRILAAEFLNAGRLVQAFWFPSSADEGGEYYDAEGRARKRAFLASPLEFSRVTSGFALRLHPILKQWREHRGIDYAAPTGTSVRVVADGVVSFAGVQQGYGNVVEVTHTKERSTLYAHLSRIDVQVGQRVNQASNIGAVGSTGMSTGPHLHFEFRVAGVHQDPELITKQTGGLPLEAGDLARFVDHTQSMRAGLDWAAEQFAFAGRRRFE
jgi:murein DD-endopeptidase MepM/ murein hydrolase activator NlpD